MESESEDECVELVRLLPSTEASLLDWAINLMADVVEMEQLNKMNARNIAMVFAPNMTQVSFLNESLKIVWCVRILVNDISQIADVGSIDGSNVCCASYELSENTYCEDA